MNKAIILANGQFPKRKEALQAMLQAPLLICCDGAYDKLVASGLFSHATVMPEIVTVGDGDSIELTDEVKSDTRKLKALFIDRYASDQDTNDLTKSVRYAVSRGVTHIVILGATGLREDHTLGNISLLGQYANMTSSEGKPLSVRMYSDYGYFTPVVAAVQSSGSTSPTVAKFKSYVGQQVSLFSLYGDMLVTVEGLKYPIVRRNLKQLWEATLNEATADSFKITLEGAGMLLVYQTH